MSAPLKVLLLEDSDDDAALVLRALRKGTRAVSVERVADGPSFETALQEGAWDLILSDYSLPGYSGSDALHALRSTGRDIPFILVSGAIGEETAADIMRRGARDVVRKDNLNRLVPAIERELEEADHRRLHREAEEALRKSEERFSQISGLTGELIWEVDAEGLYTYISPACASLIGYREDEVVGRLHFYDLHPEEGREAFRAAAFDTFRRKARFKDLPNPIQAKDGRILEVITNGIPILAADGSLRGYRGSDQDVTEKHRSERLVARLATAVQQVGDVLIVTDGEGRIEYVNPAFESATGFTHEEALGSLPGQLLRHQEKASAHPDLWPALQSEGLWRGRFINRHKDGRTLLHDASISAIRGSDGAVLGYVSSQRDVTRQVEMEVHLAQASRLEAIGTLAGGIAHDFNNLLSAIQGFTEVALLKTPPDGVQRRPLSGILQATARAKELVQQILAFNRQKASRAEAVQVGLILKEALRFIRATVPTTIDITSDVASEALVAADPTDLHRIIVNLCTNAVLAMHGATGRLDVRLTDTTLAPDLADRMGIAPGPYARVTVRDNGCGMSKEVASRIFEPFFTTRQGSGGTGMGLAVVHGILTSLGGTITVDSQPGVGSTFDVWLPAVGSQGPRTVQPAEEFQKGSGVVLFVDDEAMLCDMAQEMLHLMGYEVEVHNDPMKALAAVTADPRRFDAVITDLSMPGMPGDVLATRLKALNPDLPVILCTGFDAQQDVRRVGNLGLTHVMAKPFSWVRMSVVLKECLKRPTLH